MPFCVQWIITKQNVQNVQYKIRNDHTFLLNSLKKTVLVLKLTTLTKNFNQNLIQFIVYILNPIPVSIKLHCLLILQCHGIIDKNSKLLSYLHKEFENTNQFVSMYTNVALISMNIKYIKSM